MVLGDFFPQQNTFSWVGIDFILEIDFVQETHPTQILGKQLIDNILITCWCLLSGLDIVVYVGISHTSRVAFYHVRLASAVRSVEELYYVANEMGVAFTMMRWN